MAHGTHRGRPALRAPARGEELFVEAHLRAGHSEDVVARAQAMVREQPLRERRWALLALAQYQAGRQGDALATLRRVRSVLGRELGLDPGPDLAALEQAVLRQDPGLLELSVPVEASLECPYRGLMPYDADDASLFFGRSTDVDGCLGRLGSAGVLAVVGASGTGKSSLVRAGVVPSLRRDGRQVVVMSPGEHPMTTLSLLPRYAASATLVVDQLEEVSSLCAGTPTSGPGSSTRWCSTRGPAGSWSCCEPTTWSPCPRTVPSPASSSRGCT